MKVKEVRGHLHAGFLQPDEVPLVNKIGGEMSVFDNRKWCVQCAQDKDAFVEATEIHFGNGYCSEHSKGWHPELKRLPRKSIRRELKDIKSSLRQLAAEAGSRDRAWGEQIDRMADRVGEMVEKI